MFYAFSTLTKVKLIRTGHLQNPLTFKVKRFILYIEKKHSKTD